MRALLFLSCILFLNSCGFEYRKDQGAMVAASGARVLNRAVSFAEVQQTVFAGKCLTCHSNSGGNRGGINLESYAAATATGVVSRLEKSALVNRTMPPAGSSLSDQEFAVLNTWIQQGASLQGSVQKSKIDSGPLTFLEIKQKIFVAKCLDCHSLPKPEGDLDLNDIEQVRKKADRIFERAVYRGDMPLAPYEVLTSSEKKALAGWLGEGAP